MPDPTKAPGGTARSRRASTADLLQRSSVLRDRIDAATEELGDVVRQLAGMEPPTEGAWVPSQGLTEEQLAEVLDRSRLDAIDEDVRRVRAGILTAAEAVDSLFLNMNGLYVEDDHGEEHEGIVHLLGGAFLRANRAVFDAAAQLGECD